MFNSCIYEFVCEQSCADRPCVRGCDHGADVAGRNHDCSCLLTVSLTDDVDCLQRDGKTHRRHLRRRSPQTNSEPKPSGMTRNINYKVYCLWTL